MQLATLIKLLVHLLLFEPETDQDLVARLHVAMPGLHSSEEHVLAASNAAHAHGLPVDLLLGMSYVESRFDPTATSRVVDGKRVTGSWPHLYPAGSGKRFCGNLQTMAETSWRTCLAMRSPLIGYWIGAEELRVWLRVTHGSIRAALRGYGCGFAGLKNGCNGYDLRVLSWARRFAARSN